MAAQNGTYRIFCRPMSSDSGADFSDTGESYTGTIGGAFDFAATLQAEDPGSVYIPLVGYELRYGDSSPQAVPSPAVNLAGAPVPIANNRASMVWEQCGAELDYVTATLGDQSWGLQSYGPG